MGEEFCKITFKIDKNGFNTIELSEGCEKLFERKENIKNLDKK